MSSPLEFQGKVGVPIARRQNRYSKRSLPNNHQTMFCWRSSLVLAILGKIPQMISKRTRILDWNSFLLWRNMVDRSALFKRRITTRTLSETYLRIDEWMKVSEEIHESRNLILFTRKNKEIEFLRVYVSWSSNLGRLFSLFAWSHYFSDINFYAKRQPLKGKKESLTMGVIVETKGYEGFSRSVVNLASRENLFVFYTGGGKSLTDPGSGNEWCPICREAHPIIVALFKSHPTATLLIVYISQEYAKSKDNKFKTDKRVLINEVPVLMKWGGQQRLSGDQCKSRKLIKLLLDESN